ncbi:MAG: RNA methyltransferase [Candidatus Baltobacteraceae bacterium]
MPIPLGDRSERLAAIRTLTKKRGRLDRGRFLVEGTTLLAEALRSGVAAEAVFGTEAGYRRVAALGLGPFTEEASFLVGERAMRSLSDLDTPPGVVAVCEGTIFPTAALLAEGEPVLLLAGLADPGNAGTLLRSAEAFGVSRTIFGKGTVEPYNPKVVRGSMGSIFRTKLAIASPDELASAALESGYSVVASTRGGVPLHGFAFPARTVLAIGSERHGVDGWLRAWDAAVGIPHVGPTESLNAAVAGSIVLYEFALSRGSSSILSTRREP